MVTLKRNHGDRGFDNFSGNRRTGGLARRNDYIRGGFGLLCNIIIDFVGGIISGFLFRLLAITAGGLIGSIVTATVQDVLLLYWVGLVKKA
jgi:uncharacterized membrane protein YeaQ/YmgE (transglycosylase-associated protein family)